MKLSSAPSEMRAGYDVVVVGSGYGASITAARLAAAGAKVCILERGREFALGEFPTTESSVREHFQVDADEGRLGNRLALYDLHFNPDMSVLVGCGLGGTSLINANVSIEPDPRVFQEPEWPAELRDPQNEDGKGALAAYFDRARSVLRPAPYPSSWPTPAKLSAIQEAAEKSGHRFHRAQLNVHFEGDEVHGGVHMKTCKSCGNCVTGCNFGAKKTTATNYLPMAKTAGAHIFTQHEVVGLEQAKDGWTVKFRALQTGKEKGEEATGQVQARAVVLGAGVMGSTGILLRAKAAGLSLSPRLGTRFGGNGDELAAGFNFDRRINSVGYQGRGEPGDPPNGALITGIVDARDPDKPLALGLILEEGGFPGPMTPLSRLLIDILAMGGKDTTTPGWRLWLRRAWRIILGFISPRSLDTALNHSQLYLIMGHDDSGGTIKLGKGARPRISWPSTKDSGHLFERENLLAKEVTAALKGVAIKNPLSKSGMMNSLITVHPLGGSPMGDDPDKGVVDHAGRVFRGDGGGVYPGLYVADGAIVPRSLGVNPLLTISALAERVADHAARDLGLTPAASA